MIIENIKSTKIHSKTDHKTNFFAFVNIVCVAIGVGILGLPYALVQGGWICIVMLVFTGIVSVITGELLIECLYVEKGRRMENYSEIGFQAFGYLGKSLVTFFHFVSLLSCACVYIILMGMNMFDLTGVLNLQLWVMISGVAVLVPCLILRSIKEAIVLTFFGMFSTLIVVVIVAVFGLLDLPPYDPITHPLFNLATFPLAIGPIAFSYGGNNLYPEIEKEMNSPKQFNKILRVSIMFITVIYVLISSVGYLSYGDYLLTPILLNLSSQTAKIVSILFITAHVYLAAPIFLCTFFVDVERCIDLEKYSKTNQLITRSTIRTMTIFMLTTLAMYLPFFNDFMSLFGAFTNCVLVFILPVVYHYKLFGFKNRSWMEYIIHLSIVVIGVVSLLLGCYQATLELVSDFNA